MKRRIRGWAAGWAAAVCLLLVQRASAGPHVNIMQPCDCPPTHYSAFHVLTPVVYRWAAWCWGPRRYTFAKNMYPSAVPTFYVTKYHCPTMNPLQFSVINYPGLGSPAPGSTYQPPPQPAQAQTRRESPPQELPPPRIEKSPELLPLPKEEPNK